MNGPAPAGRGARPGAGFAVAWQTAEAVNDTHTGTTQQVSTAQNDPAGHVNVGAGPQLPIAEHDVAPSTQNPPPVELVTQTQLALVAQGMNVAQVAPIHCGFGPGDPCADSGTADASTIGAT
jgi:hypothetical protein